MKWLILIPLLVVCGCVGYYRVLSGYYPKSLSATSLYGKYGKWVFGGSMVLSALCTWLCCTSVLSDNYLWLTWLACVSLLLVAWFNSETKVHTIAARTAGVMMTILTAAVCPLALTACITSLMRHAPSKRLYSVCRCRWVNDMVDPPG